ncbi:hypothetical protein [Actinacidiphila acidipaludis]|uniref:Uncharacterized protein n=1 Tax=Actinacidiphila acidipaludis TaxID=2873382 RepID=A0ABS7QG43_9ACTN|nr:hypothetical protein [Streptomyces acidipaludis]MBY8882143.1 hypothetical protein [Streptomyces acidipaludis]
MLTALSPAQGAAVGFGYRCEVTAHGASEQIISLGASATRNRRLALRWLTGRAQDVTDQLDEPYARPGRHWQTDMAEHERAMAVLAQGSPYSVTFTDDACRYRLTIHPRGSSR